MLDYIEFALAIVFILDIFVRLFASPNIKKLLISPINILDVSLNLLSILCYARIITNLDVIRSFEVLRVFYVFKFFRYFPSLKLLIVIVKSSMEEFRVLLVYLFFGVVLFSSLVFLAEKISNPNTAFESIPESIWYVTFEITFIILVFDF